MILLTVSESLVEDRFKTPTIGAMRKNLSTESYLDILSEILAEGGLEPLIIGSLRRNLTTALS